MTKKCNFCGNKNSKYTVIQYVYKHNGKFMIVDGVPCEQCEYCGEQYFRADVLQKIENDFLEIHASRRKAQSELLVPIEQFS